MIVTISEIIELLRLSVNVEVPAEDGEGKPISVIDPAYLELTDEQIMLFIKLAISRAYPRVSDPSDLPDGSEYPIVLLAKIELYLKLAVSVADNVDLGAESAHISRSQRFDHYMKLVEETRAEYDDWLANESLENNTVTTHDVLLSKWHYTNRNYEKQSTPIVNIKVDEVTTDSIHFHWDMYDSSHFGKFVVYLSESDIVDMYKDGAYYTDKLNEDARLIKNTLNIRNNYHEITGLTPNTTYHIAVFSVERNQVFGVREIQFTTLAEDGNNEEIEVTDLNG